MMNSKLKDIKTYINLADDNLSSAERIAKKAGDSDGVKKLATQRESLRELKKDFDSKGK